MVQVDVDPARGMTERWQRWRRCCVEGKRADRRAGHGFDLYVRGASGARNAAPPGRRRL